MNKLFLRGILFLPVVAVVATAGCLSIGSGAAEGMKPSLKSFEAQGYSVFPSSGYEMMRSSREVRRCKLLELRMLAAEFRGLKEVYSYATNNIVLTDNFYAGLIVDQERFVDCFNRLSCGLMRYEFTWQGGREHGLLVVRDGRVWLKLCDDNGKMEIYDDGLKEMLTNEGLVP